jgi:predicted ArsR family transcriptional regulator
VTDAPPVSSSLQPVDSTSRAGTSEREDLETVALLADPNRRRLYEIVVARGEVGRDGAADALGISRELAAFHLDRLVEAGLLEATFRRLTGRTGPGAGRPAKLYRRARRELAVSLPARRYASIAETFAAGLTELARDVGLDAVTRSLATVARARGYALGRETRTSAGSRPTRRRLRDALQALLVRAGYEPRTEATGTLALCNCPYRATSDAYRDLTCGTNYAWAQGLVDGLGGDMTAEFVPGTGDCCVRFSSPAPGPR